MLIPHFSSPMTRQFLTKELFNKAAKICHVLLIIKIETERDSKLIYKYIYIFFLYIIDLYILYSAFYIIESGHTKIYLY